MEGIFLCGIPNRIRLTAFKKLMVYYERQDMDTNIYPQELKNWWILRDVDSATCLLTTYWASTM